MVTICVKSFNRAFYLDRCLQSIQQMVEGNYTVVVLDDGTPEKYLTKIKEKFPNVEIRLSKDYEKKTQAIAENLTFGTPINGFQIPTELWYNAVKNADDYVLVTEDDVWFTQKINLDNIAQEMKLHQVALVKLGWLGNAKDDQFLSISSISEKINRIVPKKIFTSNPFIMDCFIYNKFKFFTILYKLGWVDNLTRRKYWALNSIAMGLYHKDYWQYIWKDAKGKTDEKQQLRNAAVWYHRFGKNKNLIARTEKECLKTTFQSSATNSYHAYHIDFDVNYFNYLINEAWYNGTFDAMQNFPGDFSMDYFDAFLDEKISRKTFHDWVEKFREQYRNNGADVNPDFIN